MGKSEKTLLLRFNLNRKTDREIWEWLHEKSESQTLSMNAFLIEGLRKLMAQEANEKPLDVRALAEELCRELRTQRLHQHIRTKRKQPPVQVTVSFGGDKISKSEPGMEAR